MKFQKSKKKDVKKKKNLLTVQIFYTVINVFKVTVFKTSFSLNRLY